MREGESERSREREREREWEREGEESREGEWWCNAGEIGAAGAKTFRKGHFLMQFKVRKLLLDLTFSVGVH